MLARLTLPGQKKIQYLKSGNFGYWNQEFTNHGNLISNGY